MKRSIIVTIALLVLALPAAAQQRMSGPPQSGTGLFQGITLSAAQQKKVDSLWTSNQPMRDKVRAQMESGQRPDSAQMAAFREASRKSVASYRAFLTPDQQAVFDRNVEAMRASMQ